MANERPRPVPGDERDFAARVMRDPNLYAIACGIEHELHESRITIDDAIRLGVYAAQRYLERRAVPLYIHIDTSRPVVGCVECGNDYAEGYCPHSARERAGA